MFPQFSRCTGRGKKLWKSIKRKLFSDSSTPNFSGSLNFNNDRNIDSNYKHDNTIGNHVEGTNILRKKENACYSNPVSEPPPYTVESGGNKPSGFQSTIETKKIRASGRHSSSNNARTNHYKPGHSRLVSKPSITSGYMSDVDVGNDSTTGSSPYASRRNIAKPRNARRSERPPRRRKRRRRRMSTSASNIDLSYDSKKYATTSALTLGTLSNNNEMKRRHSMLSTTNSIRSRHVKHLHQNKQCQRSASDAHLSQQHRGLMTGFGRLSLRRSHHQFEVEDNDFLKPHSLRKQENEPNKSTNDANKTSTSGRPLVRSMTILEIPILPSETAGDHSYDKDVRKHEQHHNYRSKKSSSRPTSSYGAARKTDQSRRRKEIRQPRDKWMYGYNSLPTDWRKTDYMLQQMGMTTESLVEPIEKLNIDKLCRPIPNIEDEQRSKSMQMTDL